MVVVRKFGLNLNILEIVLNETKQNELEVVLDGLNLFLNGFFLEEFFFINNLKVLHIQNFAQKYNILSIVFFFFLKFFHESSSKVT